jgi:tRNA (cmo5U34)-methyltransferase
MDQKTGWQTDEAAQRYGRFDIFMIPGRTEVLEIFGRLALTFCSKKGSILDLGCGYGDITAAVLQKSPRTSAVLIDYSDEMVRRAEERFRHNPEIMIVKYDLNTGIPNLLSAAVFDVVVSGFTFHHIDLSRRLPLYTQIHHMLKTGGVFIIADRFVEESPEINAWMFNSWVKWMAVQAKEKLGISTTFDQVKARQMEKDRDFGDKPGSLWAMEKDLRAAGFTCVDCLFKNQVIAMVAAVKYGDAVYGGLKEKQNDE